MDADLTALHWSSTMNTSSHKDYYLEKHRNRGVMFLIDRKLLIHKQLEKPARTYVVYTDLHGSYDKYIHWLKNGFGYFHIAISEILGQEYSPEICRLYERLLLLVNRDRIDQVQRHVAGELPSFTHEEYFFCPVPEQFARTLDSLEQMGLTPKRILKDLFHLLRTITRGDEHRIFKAVPTKFQEIMVVMFFRNDWASYGTLIDAMTENQMLYHMFSSFVVKLSIANMLEKHVNLGDSLDRGDEADKLLQFFQVFFDAEVNSPPMHYIWGNHDILWLGASVGNPILCMTALRISMRYNNVAFLDRYGFDLSGLRNLAMKTYRLTPTGSYTKLKKDGRWSLDEVTKITKTLLILESKLTLKLTRLALEIPGQIDYSAEHQRYLELMGMLPTGVPEDQTTWQQLMAEEPLFSDVFFPTLDADNREALTEEEQQVVDDLVRQFTTLPRFQADMKWLFWKGEMYRVVDHTLLYHAALPATDNMELAEIKGRKGKELLDWLQRDLKRIGENWAQGTPATLRERMLLWYLWCGEDSPFFCKSKMATLERAVFHKEPAAKDPLTTWKEAKNLYYNYIRDDRFLNRILQEFHADRLVMGHTPVGSAMEGMLSQDVRAFIVDGGASRAYGDRGASLIVSPDYTYLTFHPTLDDLIRAEQEDRLPEVEIHPLQERTISKIRHSEKGYFLRQELEAIDELLEESLPPVYAQYFVKDH